MATFETQIEGTISPTNWIVQPGTLRSDGGTSVATDVSGNVYLAGYTEGYLPGGRKPGELFINNDSLLFKFNNNGEKLWQQQFGNSALNDQAYAVAVDPAGNVYVAGTTDESGVNTGGQGGGSEAFLTKFSSTGQLLWQKKFGSTENDTAYGLAIDGAGYVYVTGESAKVSPNIRGSNAFLTKFDGNGTQIWNQPIDLQARDIGYGVTVDSANNIYVVGQTGSVLQGTDPGEKDAFVARYDTNGNQQWATTSGWIGFDAASAVTVDRAGFVYVAGTFTQADSDIYAFKFTSAGDKVWDTGVDLGKDDVATGIAIDANNNVYVTGQTNQSLFSGYMGGSDTLLVKFDIDGNRLGTHQIGTLADDMANGTAVDIAGNVFVAGVTMGTLGASSQGYNDAFLIKYGNNPLPAILPEIPPLELPTNTQPDNDDNVPGNNQTPGNNIDVPQLNPLNLRGSVRADRLQGGVGDDTLSGLQGNDRLVGSDGNDRLLGGAGRDHLSGGNGSDYLDGGIDSDRLLGGTGIDRFILSKGKGFDTILDFQRGEDKMILPRGVSVRQVDMTQVGRRAFVSYGEDVLAVLPGFQVNSVRGIGLES